MLLCVLPIPTHSLDDDVMATTRRAAAALVAERKSAFDALWTALIFSTFGRLKTKKLVRMAGPRQNFMLLLAGTWNPPATTVLVPPKDTLARHILLRALREQEWDVGT
jgi:DNA-binding transcriptional regulator PaaX